jgi:hypothetical protein
LIDVDPRSWDHVDLTILRIQIGVRSKEVVLPCRHMFFIDDLRNYRYHTLQFNVEDEYAFTRTKQNWQTIQSKLLETSTANISPIPVSLPPSVSVLAPTTALSVPIPTLAITHSTITAPTPITFSVPLTLSHSSSVPLLLMSITSILPSTTPLSSLVTITLSSLSISEPEVPIPNIDTYQTKDPILDDWDPWEAASANSSQVMVVYEPSQAKRKTPPALRHSAQLQTKLSTGAKSKVSATSDSSFQDIDTNYVLEQFPFGHFTNSEAVSLFEKIDFSLGNKENTRLLVAKFRSLFKSRFSSLVTDLALKHTSILSKVSTSLVDISGEVLDASNKG